MSFVGTEGRAAVVRERGPEERASRKTGSRFPVGMSLGGERTDSGVRVLLIRGGCLVGRLPVSLHHSERSVGAVPDAGYEATSEGVKAGHLTSVHDEAHVLKVVGLKRAVGNHAVALGNHVGVIVHCKQINERAAVGSAGVRNTAPCGKESDIGVIHLKAAFGVRS